MTAPANQKSVLVNFPIDVYDALRNRARVEDRTITGLVRWATLSYLNDSTDATGGTA